MKCSEREYRMWVYPRLLEFFVQADSMSAIMKVSAALENIIKANAEYFREVRKRIIEKRRNSK
ncbi:hypothetical protein [Vulcanisaeta sp. JCM 14467]